MSPSGRTIRVLHVDDEPDFVDLAEEHLERQNERLTVESVVSVDAALERLDQEEFDCIVSDYDMPEHNGIEFLERVREDYPGLPFILYTGKGSEEIASEAISAGVTDYIQKETGTSQYQVLANRITNVVEQYRVRQEIAETEQRLRTIAEHSSDILWKFNADWNELLFINSPYEEIWGRSIEELRERPQSFLEGIHPEDRSKVTDAMERLSVGESVDIEYRVNADEDFGRWVWVQGEPVFDEAGDVEKVVGFARDITDRKERETELQRERDRVNALFEHSVDAIVYAEFDDGQPIVRDVNPAFEETFGYDRESTVGHPIDEFIVPEEPDKQQEASDLNRRIEAGERVVTEVRRQTADGVRDFLLQSTPLEPGESGRQTYAIYHDITERKDRERQLKQAQELTEALSSTFPDYTFIYNDEGEYLDVITGWEGGPSLYAPEELIGQHVGDVLDDETAERIQDAIQATLESGELQTTEYSIETAGGTYWYEANLAPLEAGYGDQPAVVLSARDITERREREQALQRQNERLEEFASMVSHDLRNPLSLAKGRLELAIEERDWQELDAVARAHEQMETRIEDMLELASAREPLDAAEAVELGSLAETCWRSLEGDSASLVVETDVAIRADEARLEQLLENVLGNAIEHAGPEVEVTIGELPGGFYIEDDGPGIPEGQRDDVFDPGYSSGEEGSGFGLSIVRDIAEAHGWEVTVTDGAKGGTRVEIVGVEAQ